MTAILGISAFYHDSAAALVVDGEIVAAAEEERFTRVKHDCNFPHHAIEFCLAEAGLTPEQLDYVGFYEKPVAKFVRLLETYLAFVPAGYRSFRQAMPLWLKRKLYLPREIHRGLRGRYPGRIVFTEHHESHAASAFFPSPFEEAAILTVDGVGEWTTASFGVGRGRQIELTYEIRFPHSLGLLYSAFTYYTGFRVNSGEYKVMGLAPFGKPVYADQILRQLVDLKEDGSFRLNLSYFDFCQGLTMTSRRFDVLFGGPPRRPGAEITQREMDLAASVQAVTEEVLLRMARHVQHSTGLKNLVLAGGVALNCVANGRILREGPFDNLWIQPAAGDAGGALGTALFVWHQLLERSRPSILPDRQRGSFLGPQFSEAEIQQTLSRHGAVYEVCATDAELCDAVAELIAQKNVVGWFEGRMEFGPRALGARSILADARDQNMPSILNRTVKFRESFRPFAPMVLREYVDQYFEMRPGEDSPYMLVAAPIRCDRRTPLTPESERAVGFEKLAFCRSQIPAVTHVDHSARVQTVDRERNPLVHQLLTSYHRQTGCPVLINTSLNVRGEPIACTPDDAYRCFMATGMDALVLGRHLLLKSKQPQQASDVDRREHLRQFQLD